MSLFIFVFPCVLRLLFQCMFLSRVSFLGIHRWSWPAIRLLQPLDRNIGYTNIAMIWEAMGKVVDIEANQSFAVYYKIPQLKEYRQLLYESDVVEMFSLKNPKKIIDLYVTVEETRPLLQCEASKGKMPVTRKGGNRQNMGWTEPAF